MSKSGYWFAAKRDGWGWGWGLPLTWQGWLVYLLTALLLVAGFFIFPPRVAPAGLALFNMGVALLAVLVCVLKGEPLRRG